MLVFPFLFGGTFIEGPSHSYGLPPRVPRFPFLFGGTFIEGIIVFSDTSGFRGFPFLFGGTFIEGISHVVLLFNFSFISLPFRRDFH